jgi:pilus assembly protein TadC
METNWNSTTPDPDEEPQLNLAELATFLKGPLDIRSIALGGLFLLAVFGTLYVARSVFMPIVLALLLSFLLAPLVTCTRVSQKHHCATL